MFCLCGYEEVDFDCVFVDGLECCEWDWECLLC